MSKNQNVLNISFWNIYTVYQQRVMQQNVYSNKFIVTKNLVLDI